MDRVYEATGALGENNKRQLVFDKLTIGGLDEGENEEGMIGCMEEIKINDIPVQDYPKIRIIKKLEVLDQLVHDFYV